MILLSEEEVSLGKESEATLIMAGHWAQPGLWHRLSNGCRQVPVGLAASLGCRAQQPQPRGMWGFHTCQPTPLRREPWGSRQLSEAGGGPACLPTAGAAARQPGNRVSQRKLVQGVFFFLRLPFSFSSLPPWSCKTQKIDLRLKRRR